MPLPEYSLVKKVGCVACHQLRSIHYWDDDDDDNAGDVVDDGGDGEDEDDGDDGDVDSDTEMLCSFK